jgi:penicillin-binding protein 2
MPRLVLDRHAPPVKSMGFRQDHLDYIHAAMSEVVNGRGTAGRARLPVENVLMAGKTGTAQVVGLNVANGKSGVWKYRDHGHFIAFAPFDKPKYACAVVIEHGGGSGAAGTSGQRPAVVSSTATPDRLPAHSEGRGSGII